MKQLSTKEIRQLFLDYFNELNHAIVDSSNLVPADDPTLLFTNAGMVQFKDVFLGLEKRDYNRAVTSQKCLRVSGKHNDLENVGPSPRHHTFFEMLGNFSFGDYFKREAIQFAWHLLVNELGLPTERLWFTVYTEDDEAEKLWHQVGAAPDRVLRFGKKDNWWAMGDVGPCGPCSEIHFYWGDLDKQVPGGVNKDDEYLEIWNLVFMQYEQKEPGGELIPLPKPSVDTGAGLERLASILQGKDNNYDTDAFAPIMQRIQELLGHSDAQRQEHLVGYRVIADHSRAMTFLVGDGVLPGNESRNYVLRMVLRRAARFGKRIGFEKPITPIFPPNRASSSRLSPPRRNVSNAPSTPVWPCWIRSSRACGKKARASSPATRSSACGAPTASPWTSPGTWPRSRVSRLTKRATGRPWPKTAPSPKPAPSPTCPQTCRSTANFCRICRKQAAWTKTASNP